MSDEPLRIGVLGLSHDHVWSNLEELQQSDLGVLVAAADANEPLREKVHDLYGCRTYADVEQLLESEPLDAVYLYGDNRSGVEWTAQAAARGLSVLVEKPLADSLAGAERMLAACQEHNVRLMVNWPFAWWPQMQHALRMVAEGKIGRVWQVKYRAAHAGPRELGCSEYFCDWLYDAERNGGGALIDYGCYGALLATCLLGLPRQVAALSGCLTKGEDFPVEDNALLMMQYDRATALAEASWSQIGNLTSYMTAIYGTAGTLQIEPRAGARLLLASEESPLGIEVDVPTAAKHLRNASEHFLYCLKTGEDFQQLADAAPARDAQEIMSAGQLASKNEKAISLPIADV